MKGTNEETTGPLVRFHKEEPFVYHYCPPNRGKTVCGIELEGREHQRFSDPGDIMDPCDQCRHFRPDVTNREIVKWIGDVVGFELHGESPPAYLSKDQLVAIRDWIKGHKEETDG